MSTLVVSDLHLGGRTGADVLSDVRHRAALLEALDGVDRLVLLGDVVEPRHGALRDVLERARPALEDLGRAMADKEVVLVAGNHDHVLVRGWLDAWARDERPALELEHRITPAQASWAAERMAGWLGADVSVAYPGLWLRDDVYATHGHYLDLHNTVPNFERIAAAITTRVAGRVPHRAEPADYEARLAPIYAWVDTVAEWAPARRAAGSAGSGQRAYRMLTRSGPRSIRDRLIAGAFPIGIAAINRAGIGPLSADLSGPAMRRATLDAMHEVVRRLGIGAEHVIFGHSHRKGPLPADDPAEWRGLVNSGCWVFETHFMSGSDPESPYWPGGAVRVDADGPPRLERLLGAL